MALVGLHAFNGAGLALMAWFGPGTSLRQQITRRRLA